MLKMDSCPFSKEQVKALKDKINASANGTTINGGKVQLTMNYIHEYLSEDQLKIVLADDVEYFVVLDLVSEVLTAILWLHPRPNSSQKHLVSFIHALLGDRCSPDDFYRQPPMHV